jgi:hypothetical protein
MTRHNYGKCGRAFKCFFLILFGTAISNNESLRRAVATCKGHDPIDNPFCVGRREERHKWVTKRGEANLARSRRSSGTVATTGRSFEVAMVGRLSGTAPSRRSSRLGQASGGARRLHHGGSGDDGSVLERGRGVDR